MFQVYEECFKILLDTYSSGEFYRELYSAKQEYFQEFGIINEDDPDFENQMDVFMGWYLFDRNLKNFDLPPIQLFYRKNADSLPEEKRLLFRNIMNSIHSIFENLKKKGDSILLREYCTKKKYEILDSRYSLGFTKGDIFEARILELPEERKYCFVEGFCFHPKESVKFIDNQIKKIRLEDIDQRNKLLFKLGQMKLKHQRFPHIDIKHIYTLTPKF